MNWLKGKPKNEVIIDMVDSELKTINNLKAMLDKYYPNTKTARRITTVKGILNTISTEIPATIKESV